MIMIRTQIQIEDDQIEWLRAKAKARGVSVSRLIREGVALFRAHEERFPEEKESPYCCWPFFLSYPRRFRAAR